MPSNRNYLPTSAVFVRLLNATQSGLADTMTTYIFCVFFPKKIALMDLLEEVKKRSSKWIKTKGEAYLNFYWQRGYGAFSVNPRGVPVVARYIDNQAIHHRKKDFKDEFRAYLHKYQIEYDERYVWD